MDLPSTPPQYLYPMVYLGVTNPIQEFRACLKKNTSPSLKLLIRVIKTIAFSIFRWHLHDHIFLKEVVPLQDLEDFIHSFDGKIQKEKKESIEKQFPHLLSSSTFYAMNLEVLSPTFTNAVNPYIHLDVKKQGHTIQESAFKKMKAKEFHDFFVETFGVNITKKQNPSIFDVIHSKRLITQEV